MRLFAVGMVGFGQCYQQSYVICFVFTLEIVRNYSGLGQVVWIKVSVVISCAIGPMSCLLSSIAVFFTVRIISTPMLVLCFFFFWYDYEGFTLRPRRGLISVLMDSVIISECFKYTLQDSIVFCHLVLLKSI